MRKYLAQLYLATILLGIPAAAQPAETGSISGRITISDRPVEGVVVSLEGGPGEAYSIAREGLITRTDEGGNYRFDSVPRGRHLVVPRAEVYVLPLESGAIQPGRYITIAPGDKVEGLNFDLVPGGVITGKITDHTGRPAVSERVQVWVVGKDSRPVQYRNPALRQLVTDDLGVYRIFGMPAGQYIVGVGEDTKSGNLSIFSGSESSIPFFPIVYYPAAREIEGAQILVLAEGKELTDVNIVMAKPEKTFLVKGRVLDGETRNPVAGALYGYGSIKPGATTMRSFGYTGARTNENGEFSIQALPPGNYGIYVRPDAQSDYYLDQAAFEVTDHDIDNFEITANKGGSISGRLEVQNGSLAEVLFKGIRLTAVNASNPASASQLGGNNISPDGTFQATGLKPGKINLDLTLPPGIKVLKMERDGVRFTDGIQLNQGEKVTGIKVSLAAGNGIIRGQLNFEGGKLPEGTRFFVSGNRLDEPADTVRGPEGSIIVDALGRFTIDGLLPGDYEITVTPIGNSAGGLPVAGLLPMKKTVNVGNVPASLVFNVDLSKIGGK